MCQPSDGPKPEFEKYSKDRIWYTTIFALSIGVAALKDFGMLIRELDWRAALRWRFGF
jgi:hypothetical protein